MVGFTRFWFYHDVGELATKLLHKIFPISWTIQLSRDSASFKQFDDKNLYEAWEHFKALLRMYPHHEMQEWLKLQIFYNGLDSSLRDGLASASGGAFMNNIYEWSYQLTEDMAMKLYM